MLSTFISRRGAGTGRRETGDGHCTLLPEPRCNHLSRSEGGARYGEGGGTARYELDGQKELNEVVTRSRGFDRSGAEARVSDATATFTENTATAYSPSGLALA